MVDTTKLRIGWYGFYDDPSQTVPVHDPGHSAPCLFCFEPWTSETVRTISLMPLTRTGSYFYRVHRACHEQWMADHPGEGEPPSEWLLAAAT